MAGSLTLLAIAIVVIWIVKTRRPKHRKSRSKYSLWLILKEEEQIEAPSPTSKLKVLEDVHIRGKIGEGSFGDVYLAEWNTVLVAAKKLVGKAEWVAFQREAEFLEY